MAAFASADAAEDEALGEPQLRLTLNGRGGEATSTCFTTCAFVPGRQQIVTGAQDGSVLVWPLASLERRRPIRLPAAPAGGAPRATASVGAGGASASSSVEPAPVTAVAVSEGGGLIAASSTDGAARVWRNQVGQQAPQVVKVHFGPVRCCDLSPKGARLLLTCSDDKMVKLSSLPERRFIASFVGHSNWVQSAHFSPLGEALASGGDDRTVRLWDLERRSAVRVWHDHAGSVSCTRFDHTGSCVAACAWDSTINLWDVRSHALRQHYARAHGSSPISSIAFHPREDLLLSASTDRTLRLWDLRAGRLRYTVRGHERPVQACCWDADSGEFASCDSRAVQLWRLPAATAAAAAAKASPRPAATPAPAAPVLPGAQRGAPSAAPAPAAPATEASSARPRTPKSMARPVPPEVLEAAWAAGDDSAAASAAAAAAVAVDPTGGPRVVEQRPELQESLARTLEQMVSQMDLITRSLQAMETRVMQTEEAVAGLSGLAAARRSSRPFS
eukprot:TRINITY_DN30541_c0_g1_i2.p1 TRINITY_DN30541_c0_g1~~TRINITY_DN30541_c0_g1_i2.p1  ORF type:complete len:503 (+),score=97.02 TRINITY_DN30541_c0_g1_i2:91-1599(+)